MSLDLLPRHRAERRTEVRRGLAGGASGATRSHPPDTGMDSKVRQEQTEALEPKAGRDQLGTADRTG